MRFGTDDSQVALVQWQFCQPGALPLGFPTPFVSRDHDSWEIWPEVGEVQFARRLNTPTVGLSKANGLAQPCGDPAVWANGYPGHVPPNYPRSVFGLTLCCGSTMGAADLGILASIPPCGGGPIEMPRPNMRPERERREPLLPTLPSLPPAIPAWIGQLAPARQLAEDDARRAMPPAVIIPPPIKIAGPPPLQMRTVIEAVAQEVRQTAQPGVIVPPDIHLGLPGEGLTSLPAEGPYMSPRALAVIRDSIYVAQATVLRVDLAEEVRRAALAVIVPAGIIPSGPVEGLSSLLQAAEAEQPRGTVRSLIPPAAPVVSAARPAGSPPAEVGQDLARPPFTWEPRPVSGLWVPSAKYPFPEPDGPAGRAQATLIPYAPPPALLHTGGGSLVSAGATVTLTWAATTATGSYLFVGLLTNGVTAVTPPAGYSLLSTQVVSAGATMRVYGSPTSSARATDAFGLSPPSTAAISGAEIGNLTSTAVDQTSSNTGTSGTASTGTSGQTTQPFEVGLNAMGDVGIGGPGTSPTNGWALYVTSQSVTLGACTIFQKSLVGVATQSMACTLAASVAWACYLATFK